MPAGAHLRRPSASISRNERSADDQRPRRDDGGVQNYGGSAMSVNFPGESAEYRAARDQLLTQEIELRRSTEAVAAGRRELPPGGEVPEDYVFPGEGTNGKPAGVRLSAVVAAGRDCLAVYSIMFPRD